MFDISILNEHFNNVDDNGEKVFIKDNLLEILKFLKDYSEFDFDILTSIVAIDLKGKIELIYQLYSSKLKEDLAISYTVVDVAPSVIDIYPSAYFDECEIYDLFGISFDGNKNLKRLFMPDTWIGYPLLKNYVQNDERLAWND